MSKNWRRRESLVVDEFLPAAVLWLAARSSGVKQADLAAELGCSPTTVHYTMQGATTLAWHRAFKLAELLGMTRLGLVKAVEELEKRLAHELDGFKKLPCFPSAPPTKSQRLVMAYDIQDRLLGHGWEAIYHELAVPSGDIWRARVAKFGTRAAAAKAFGVTPPTIRNWERNHVPVKRWEQARVVYFRHL